MLVDARGDQCPIPVIKAKKALGQLNEGEKVEVHVDNEIAVQNLLKMAKSQQCEATAGKVSDKDFVVEISKGKITETAENEKEEIACIPDSRSNTVAVISSDRMGSGNDELGKVLIKGFIYALSQLEKLPKTIIFYNGGVTLTTEGSDSIEDLKLMEAQGVKIMSCGTCLNYYGLTDKLKVGEVTNMYSIVETMASATNILRP